MPELDTLLGLSAFVGTCSVVLLVVGLWNGSSPRIDSRLDDLQGRPGTAAVPRQSSLLGAALPRVAAPLMPSDESQRTQLASRLIHAGYYNRNAVSVYLALKMILMFAPSLITLLAGVVNLISWNAALGGWVLFTGVGMLTPRFWLASRKKSRQTDLRRALPDALDIVVICLEGGLSLAEALRRVTAELQTAHPLLSAEMNIVQREILLGLSPGEALRKFAKRSDLEELRSLAAVLLQSERFGASTIKALRTHADILRQKRHQRAEERAQKAAVKIIFPTLLCIFPAIFIVILGPAIFKIMETLGRIK